MRLFFKNEIFDAYTHAEAGHQALHVYKGMQGQFPDAPLCFKRAKTWGHLLDQDKERLIRTARRLGVKRIVVGREGDSKRQHIDLCGKPLERAIKECENVRKL